MHETKEEAEAETITMLNVYADFCENFLAIPVIKGQKTDKEKFAGAEATYTIEALMHDGKALQSGTSHYFGDGFAKAFDITFTGRDNKLHYPHQTSWGMSTRIIGAIIMTHGDDNGLVLPPRVAPIQAVIVPVAFHKGGVLEKAEDLRAELSKKFRVKLDDSDNSPGWKYAEYEMKGIPLRIEIGPRDIENNQCVLAMRDSGEIRVVSLDNVTEEVERALDEIHNNLFNRALENRKNRTFECSDMESMIKTANNENGFIKALWCGALKCEEARKEKAGVTSRCIPFDETCNGGKCVCCGKEAKRMVYWGKAY